MRWTFTDQQRNELLSLGLYPEQVQRLGQYLPSLGWRCASGPRMQEVRDRLSDLAKAMGRVEKLYLRMSVSRNTANQESCSRLYLAQEALKVGQDALEESLEAATNIVSRALDDLPRTRRSTRRDSAEFVRLIFKALAGGHADHFLNRGEPVPAFLIRVARKKKPFPEIARVVSEATGHWSYDDAIRAYLKPRPRITRS
jgi:predicted DNA-binding protein